VRLVSVCEGSLTLGSTLVGPRRALQAAVPETLANMRAVAVDRAGMVAGTEYRGEFEERLKAAIDRSARAEADALRDRRPVVTLTTMLDDRHG
jgi:hypothetical protein